MAITNIEIQSPSFKKGWNKVAQGDASSVKEEIMAALKITTEPAFYSRLKGKPEPRVSEAAAIEAVFNKYGITEIWGE